MPPARSLPGCSRPEPWPRRCRPPLRAAAACTGASSSGERRRRRGRGTGRVAAGRAGAQAEGEQEPLWVEGRRPGLRTPVPPPTHAVPRIRTGLRFYIWLSPWVTLPVGSSPACPRPRPVGRRPGTQAGVGQGGNVFFFFPPGVSSRVDVPDLKQLLASTMHSILFMKFISWLFKYRKRKKKHLERKILSARGTELKRVCCSL